MPISFSLIWDLGHFLVISFSIQATWPHQLSHNDQVNDERPPEVDKTQEEDEIKDCTNCMSDNFETTWLGHCLSNDQMDSSEPSEADKAQGKNEAGDGAEREREDHGQGRGGIHDGPACPLLTNLPGEVRNMIYCLLLISSTSIDSDNIFKAVERRKLTRMTDESDIEIFPELYPAILRICRTIYHEALPLLYRGNSFHFNSPSKVSPLFQNVFVQQQSMFICLIQYSIGSIFAILQRFLIRTLVSFV